MPLVAVAFLLGQQLVADSAITVYDVTETSVRQSLVADRELGRVTPTFQACRPALSWWRRSGPGY